MAAGKKKVEPLSASELRAQADERRAEARSKRDAKIAEADRIRATASSDFLARDREITEAVERELDARAVEIQREAHDRLKVLARKCVSSGEIARLASEFAETFRECNDRSKELVGEELPYWTVGAAFAAIDLESKPGNLGFWAREDAFYETIGNGPLVRPLIALNSVLRDPQSTTLQIAEGLKEVAIAISASPRPMVAHQYADEIFKIVAYGGRGPARTKALKEIHARIEQQRREARSRDDVLIRRIRSGDQAAREEAAQSGKSPSWLEWALGRALDSVFGPVANRAPEATPRTRSLNDDVDQAVSSMDQSMKEIALSESMRRGA